MLSPWPFPEGCVMPKGPFDDAEIKIPCPARRTSRPSVGFAIIRKWPAWAAGSSSRSERAKRGGSSIRLTKLGPSSGPRWIRSEGSDDSSSRAAVTSSQKPKSAMGLVSRVSPVQTAMRNCTRDEGRSFGFGNQVLISSHRKLLWSKVMVVSVAEKSGHDPVRHG